MPDNMNISNAQYTQIVSGENSGIKATINGIELFVPISEDNGHYAEIMRQVEAGTLTIADAE
jgi:hypothetical protein